MDIKRTTRLSVRVTARPYRFEILYNFTALSFLLINIEQSKKYQPISSNIIQISTNINQSHPNTNQYHPNIIQISTKYHPVLGDRFQPKAHLPTTRRSRWQWLSPARTKGGCLEDARLRAKMDSHVCCKDSRRIQYIYISTYIYIYILYMSKQHVIYLYVYNIISYEIDTSHEACQIRVFHVVGWYRNYFVRMIQHHNCLNSNLQVDQRNTESVYIKKSKEKDTLLCSTKMLIPMYHIKNSQLMK